MYGGLIGTHQHSFKWYHARPPMTSPSSKLGVCNLATPLISGAGKATNFKFGGYIYRANPNNSPLKFWRKWSVGVSRDCQYFWVSPIISGTGKVTDFKFCRNIHSVDRNRSP